jgi:hypothetical protein
VLWLGAGRDRALGQALLMGQVQVSSFHHDEWMLRMRLILIFLAGCTWL